MVWCGVVWCRGVSCLVSLCSIIHCFVRSLVSLFVDFCKENWNTFNMKTVCSLRSVDPKKINTVESNRHFFCEI